MWLARKQFLALKMEAEQQKLAAEEKLAMEAQAREEEARIKEEKLKEELRITEQDTLADDKVDAVVECIKNVANPAPAETVATEVGLHRPFCTLRN